MKKKAIITGITGQDGAYLASLLLAKGYEVFGAYRRISSGNFWRIKSLGIDKDPLLKLVELDLTDLSNCIRLLEFVQPDEIYNLAAQSYVGVSFEQPITTLQITGLGALNILEAIRIVNTEIKYYQASSSEQFGKVLKVPQDENTPFYPRSPYGAAKLYAHWMTVNYRESYGIFAVSGILFNHESPLRGLEFVTRKISHGIAKIKLGMQDYLELGNLDAKRDWGYAKEYVEGMYQMLQAKTPGNYVLATNRAETVREFVNMAAKAAKIELIWQGRGISERGLDAKSGRTIVRVNPKLFRSAEVELLIGDPSKAYQELGWKAKTNLEQLCQLMVNADLERLKAERGNNNVSNPENESLLSYG